MLALALKLTHLWGHSKVEGGRHDLLEVGDAKYSPERARSLLELMNMAAGGWCAGGSILLAWDPPARGDAQGQAVSDPYHTGASFMACSEITSVLRGPCMH